MIVNRRLTRFRFCDRFIVEFNNFRYSRVIATRFFRLRWGHFGLGKRSVSPFRSGRVITTPFRSIRAFIVTTTKTFPQRGTNRVANAMSRWQRHLTISNNRCRFTRFALKREFRYIKISSFCSVVIFPCVRSILFLTFGDRAKATRFKRTREIMNFCARRVFSTTTLFFKVEFHSCSRYSRFNIAAQVGPRFLRCLMRANYMAKGNIRNNNSRVKSRFRLTFNISNDNECDRRSRPFDAVLGTRPTNRRSVTKEILRGVSQAWSCRVGAANRYVDPFIGIFLNVRGSDKVSDYSAK